MVAFSIGVAAIVIGMFILRLSAMITMVVVVTSGLRRTCKFPRKLTVQEFRAGRKCVVGEFRAAV
eukprot:2310640-Rhodomonas_salina.2